MSPAFSTSTTPDCRPSSNRIASSVAAGLRCMYRCVVDRSAWPASSWMARGRGALHRQVRTERVAQDVNALLDSRCPLSPRTALITSKRDLRPPIRVLRIGQCRGGCAKRHRRREFESNAVHPWRQESCPRPSIIAYTTLADVRSRPPAARPPGGPQTRGLCALGWAARAEQRGAP
jgi:hypothetical protein